jgi:hypothetical protein
VAVPPEEACRVDPASLVGKYVRVDGEVGLVTAFDRTRNPAKHSYHVIRFAATDVRWVLLRRRNTFRWNPGRPFAILDAPRPAVGSGAAAASAAAAAALPPPPPPPTGATARGISLRELLRLEAKIKREVASGRFQRLDPVTYQPIGVIADYEELTTGDVVHQWVKFVTGTDRLADCAALVDLSEIGLPLYFVSHAWKGRFAKLVRALKAHLRNAPDTTRVWIDCFAVNQHPDTRPAVNKADVASFEATIQQCRGGTIVVVDMRLCNPGSRGWCLYEVSS